MRMNTREKAETVFRRDVSRQMSGILRMAWIESHDTAPGFPDIVFQGIGGQCEFGMLELKASYCGSRDNSRLDFAPEPSQVQWMQKYADTSTPVWFLVGVYNDVDPRFGGGAFLVDGKNYAQLDRPTYSQLRAISCFSCQTQSMRRDLGKYLIDATRRSNTGAS